jgi:hypothetical protein
MTPEERGNAMRSDTRLILAIALMILLSAAARAQVERVAARANRPL